jgi:hypothetical protein
MLADGITLTSTAKALNFTIDSGSAFPVGSQDGELFTLLETYLGNLPGLYYYDQTADAWLKSYSDLIAYKGAYVSNTTYSINDIVIDSGSIYISLADNNANNALTNTAKWAPLGILNATNGYLPLNAQSKIDDQYLPDSLVGALTYVGVWNATSNSPTIPSASAGNKGNYYVVNTAGSTNINGHNSWNVGDWLVSNGVTWDRISNTSAVSSVAGRTGTVTLTKSDVGLANVNNTADSAKPVSDAQQAALDLKLNISTRGAAGGVCPLGNDLKVPASYLPDSITGALTYKGTWNASTNSPSIPAAATGNKGNYYIVTTAGTTTISGISNWEVGDWILSNGTSWERVASTAAVSSVAGRTGAVTLVKADVGLGNVDNTSDANKPISTATQDALTTLTNSLSGKEAAISPGSTSQYLRGDKTFQTLDKVAVGLTNVDNTADADKPISTATQAALDAKVAYTGIPYDLASAILGKPAGAAVVLRFVAVRAFSIPTNLANSIAKCGTTPTASQTLTLKKNGTAFGTMVFAAAGSTATLTATATSFAVGDVLTIENQLSADATFADCEFTIAATLS